MLEQTLYAECQNNTNQFNGQTTKVQRSVSEPCWDWIKPRARRNTQFRGVGRNDGRRVVFPYNPQQLALIDSPLLTFIFPKTGELSSSEFNSLDSTGFAQDNQARTLQVWATLSSPILRISKDRVLNSVQDQTYMSRRRTICNHTFRNSGNDNLRDVSQTVNMVRENSMEQVLDLIV